MKRGGGHLGKSVKKRERENIICTCVLIFAHLRCVGGVKRAWLDWQKSIISSTNNHYTIGVEFNRDSGDIHGNLNGFCNDRSTKYEFKKSSRPRATPKIFFRSQRFMSEPRALIRKE